MSKVPAGVHRHIAGGAEMRPRSAVLLLCSGAGVQQLEASAGGQGLGALGEFLYDALEDFPASVGVLPIEIGKAHV